jgi:hypothetical protein
MESEERGCRFCGKKIEEVKNTVYAAAGEWLSEDLWKDGGELCNQCLENRARLAMMYMHEVNR